MSVPCWHSRLSRLSGFPRQIGPDRSPAAPHPPAPLGARVRAPVGWRILDAPGVPPSPRSRGVGWGVYEPGRLVTELTGWIGERSELSAGGGPADAVERDLSDGRTDAVYRSGFGGRG